MAAAPAPDMTPMLLMAAAGGLYYLYQKGEKEDAAASADAADAAADKKTADDAKLKAASDAAAKTAATAAAAKEVDALALQPGVTSAVAAGASIVMTWKMPTTFPTGSTVKVDYRKVGDSAYVVAAAATVASSVTIVGLVLGTKYEVRVSSNVSGTPAGAATVVQTAPAGVLDLVSTSRSSTSVTLSWRAPASSTDALIELAANALPLAAWGGRAAGATFPPALSTAGAEWGPATAVVTGLVAGTAYSFRVANKTAAGNSAWTTPNLVVTTSAAAVAGAPFAPTGLRAEAFIAAMGEGADKAQTTVRWARVAGVTYVASLEDAAVTLVVVYDSAASCSVAVVPVSYGAAETFRVSAVSATSLTSEPAFLRLSAPPLGVSLSGWSFSEITASSFRSTWSNVSGSTSYAFSAFEVAAAGGPRTLVSISPSSVAASAGVTTSVVFPMAAGLERRVFLEIRTSNGSSVGVGSVSSFLLPEDPAIALVEAAAGLVAVKTLYTGAQSLTNLGAPLAASAVPRLANPGIGPVMVSRVAAACAALAAGATKTKPEREALLRRVEETVAAVSKLVPPGTIAQPSPIVAPSFLLGWGGNVGQAAAASAGGQRPFLTASTATEATAACGIRALYVSNNETGSPADASEGTGPGCSSTASGGLFDAPACAIGATTDPGSVLPWCNSLFVPSLVGARSQELFNLDVNAVPGGIRSMTWGSFYCGGSTKPGIMSCVADSDGVPMLRWIQNAGDPSLASTFLVTYDGLLVCAAYPYDGIVAHNARYVNNGAFQGFAKCFIGIVPINQRGPMYSTGNAGSDGNFNGESVLPFPLLRLGFKATGVGGEFAMGMHLTSGDTGGAYETPPDHEAFMVMIRSPATVPSGGVHIGHSVGDSVVVGSRPYLSSAIATIANSSTPCGLSFAPTTRPSSLSPDALAVTEKIVSRVYRAPGTRWVQLSFGAQVTLSFVEVYNRMGVNVAWNKPVYKGRFITINQGSTNSGTPTHHTDDRHCGRLTSRKTSSDATQTFRTDKRGSLRAEVTGQNYTSSSGVRPGFWIDLGREHEVVAARVFCGRSEAGNGSVAEWGENRAHLSISFHDERLLETSNLLLLGMGSASPISQTQAQLITVTRRNPTDVLRHSPFWTSTIAAVATPASDLFETTPWWTPASSSTWDAAPREDLSVTMIRVTCDPIAKVALKISKINVWAVDDSNTDPPVRVGVESAFYDDLSVAEINTAADIPFPRATGRTTAMPSGPYAQISNDITDTDARGVRNNGHKWVDFKLARAIGTTALGSASRLRFMMLALEFDTEDPASRRGLGVALLNRNEECPRPETMFARVADNVSTTNHTGNLVVMRGNSVLGQPPTIAIRYSHATTAGDTGMNVGLGFATSTTISIDGRGGNNQGHRGYDDQACVNRMN